MKPAQTIKPAAIAAPPILAPQPRNGIAAPVAGDLLARVAAVAGKAAARALVRAKGGAVGLFPSEASLAAGKGTWLIVAVGAADARKIASLFRAPTALLVPLPGAMEQKRRLPGVLADIERAAGCDAAMKVSRAKGGATARFPSLRTLKAGRGEWLVEAVGMETALKIAALFPKSVELEIAPVLSTKRQRRAEIERRIRLGQSPRDIAVALHIYRRHIYRIRNQLREATP